VRAPALLFIVLVALPGCTTKPKTSESPTPQAGVLPEVQRTDATLEVDNRGLVDVTVYITHDGLKERMGRFVAARRDSVFIAPRIVGLANSVQLVAETAGTRAGTQGSLSTGVITMRPGLRLVWTIESELQRSHLEIY
jgi:hypothetical protein